jgi:outer membrane receptor protein involved in Fe transport
MQRADMKKAGTVSTGDIDVQIDRATIPEAIAIIQRAAGIQVWYSDTAIPKTYRVSVHGKMSIADAFTRIFRGTSLVGRQTAPTAWSISIATDPLIVRDTVGNVSGSVVDAGSGTGIQGATVTVVGTSLSVLTDGAGRYRIVDVSPGHHTLRVRRLGYAPLDRQIVVDANTTTNVTLRLSTLANSLTQVVVTGTVIPTEIRNLPNAITVVTAKDIAARGITSIDQLFRGDVPGVVALTNGTIDNQDRVLLLSRGATSPGAGRPETTMKTYIDGVEVADPDYLNRIDPSSIDRIEILPGPQASTIYGSGAISGVMQIFTKRGQRGHPFSVDGDLFAGTSEGTPVGNVAPQNRGVLRLSGADSLTSYALSGGWQYVGAWSPGRTTTDLDGNGAVHRVLTDQLTADATVLIAQHRIAGIASSGANAAQILIGQQATGATRYLSGIAGDAFGTGRDQHTAMGVTALYQPSHVAVTSIRFGADDITADQNDGDPTYATYSDSLITLRHSEHTKSQGAVTETISFPSWTFVQSNLVAGIDGWYETVNTLTSKSPSATGTLGAGLLSASRSVTHDGGAFAQLQVGVLNTVNLTVGVRGERNNNYGADYGTNVSPRYGLSVVRDFSSFTVKGRIAYGKSTEPPAVSFRDGVTTTNSTFGTYEEQRPALLLAPQTQSGPEGGIDFYLGNLLSVSITAYRQTVRNLINSFQVDSVPSLVADPIYGYFYTGVYQFVNVGTMRNTGGDVTASLNLGQFSAKGTYTLQRSHLLDYSPQYVSFLAMYPTSTALLIGEKPLYFPEHMASGSISWANQNTQITVNANYVGSEVVALGSDSLSYLYLFPRLLPTGARVAPLPLSFRGSLGSTTTADVHMSRRIDQRFDLVFHMLNLANTAQRDVGFANPALGRRAEVGIRFRWR